MRLIPRKTHVVLASILALSAALLSCHSEYDYEGSVDRSTEYEEGPSGNPTGGDFAWNMAIAVLTSPGVHGSQNSIGDDAMPGPDNGFALSSRLEFVKKGSKFSQATTHLNYLNLVGDVVYVYNLPDKSLIYGGIGPYIGYGIGGKVTGPGFSESAFTSDGYKRFDAGLSLRGRYKMPSTLSFGLDYEYGLYDKSNDPSDYTSRNRTFAVSVGYSLTKLIRGAK